MLGTTRPRVPSGRGMSMARPKFTSSRLRRRGLPFSSTSKPLFMSVISVIASIMAQPMRWVKETLPARWRLRWLLVTTRLSNRSLTGTSRTEVAVGTVRDSPMLRTTAAAGPRSLTTSGSRSSTARICAVVGGTFAGRSEGVETAGAALFSGSAFTAGDSFGPWAAGGAARFSASAVTARDCLGRGATTGAVADAAGEGGAAGAAALRGSWTGAWDGADTGAGAGGGSGGVVVDAGEAVAGPSGDVE